MQLGEKIILCLEYLHHDGVKVEIDNVTYESMDMAAKMLCKHRKTIYRWCHNGKAKYLT